MQRGGRRSNTNTFAALHIVGGIDCSGALCSGCRPWELVFPGQR